MLAHLIAAIVLLAGLGASALLVGAERRSAAAEDAHQLTHATEARAAVTADAVEDSAQLLVAMASFPMTEHPSGAQFQAVTERLLLDRGALRGISYVAPVPSGHADGARPTVLFSGPEPSPFDGVDLGGIDAVATALDRAAGTGSPTLTEPFSSDALGSGADGDGEPEAVVAVLVPVYRAGADLSSEAARRDALLAWGAGIIELRSLLDNGSDELQLTLSDPASRFGPVVDDPSRPPAGAVSGARVEVPLLDRTWVFEGSDRAGFPYSGDAATQVAVTSVAASVALAALTLALALQRCRLRAQVQRAVARVESSERCFRAVFDNAPVGVLVAGSDGRVLQANPALLSLLGVESPEEVRISEALLPEDLREVKADLVRLTAGEVDRIEAERPVRHRDGSTVWCRMTSAALPDDEGVLSLVADITAEREAAAAAEELRRRQARFEALVRHSTDLISVLDADGMIAYASPAVSAVYGLDPETVIGSDPLDIVHPDDRDMVAAARAKAMATAGRHRAVRYRILRPDGTMRVIEVTANNMLDDPDVRGLVTNSRDVTDQAAAHELLRQRAFTDPLTGLSTRDVLLEQLGQALEEAAGGGPPVALLFVDLDGFKQVNDRFGHAAGDVVLVEVARSLAGAVRPGDMLARHGGDEFVVLLESVRDEREARAVAERVRSSLRRSVALPGGAVVEVGASVGVAMSDGSTNAAAMLSDADAALYRAKQAGRDRVEVFDEELRLRALRRHDTERVLREAVEQDALVLQFEPVVDLQEGGIVGAEARARLALPSGEVLSAAEVLPVAQEAGLASALASECLDAACRAVVAWSAGDDRARWVGLDVTAGEVTHPTFVERLAGVLSRTGVEPGSVRLELPVDVVVAAAALTRRGIAAARSLGVRVVLDGVGVELRALAALGSLEVDGLKFDLSAVPDAVHDPVAAAVAASVLQVAEAAGVSVVVVGADRDDQLELVRRLGFRYVQGRAVAPVLAADDLLAVGGRRWRQSAAG